MSPFAKSNPDRAVTRRARVIAGIFVLFTVGVLVRLVQLQVFEHDRWAAAAAAIQERVIEVPPRRGSIVDRNGTVLAFDVKAVAIAVDSYNMTKPVELARILSEELKIPLREANERIYRESYFTWIDRRVDLVTAQRIERRTREAGAWGLIFIDTWKRCYPQGSLASNVIGFVGTDGDGLEGLELRFDEHLRGRAALLEVIEGADGRTYRVDVRDPGEPGRDLTLTLDASLQFICEEEIDRGVTEFRANGGMLIVLDPSTGEILAMAQDERYDLNTFWTSTADERRNVGITDLFEPGSSFKVFSGLAALEAGVVSPGDTFNGNDAITVAGHVMHNADWQSFGTVTFAEIIEKSINTGMVRVVQRLGIEPLQGALAAFGFGAATGVELPGEEDGILRAADRWSSLDLAAASIGQSVGVTGLQLARGFAIVANGGRLLRPTIVLGDAADDSAGRRVVSEETCATMRELMRRVVTSGTGTWANVNGFDVAGKTGTAQKAVPGRGYVEGRYTSLFGGLFPAEDPRYVVVVVLDEVKTAPVSGGYTAGQIFQRAATRIARAVQLPPVARTP